MSRRPVDSSVSNSIISAFAQGRAEALERLKNQQAQQQQAIQNQRDIEEADRKKLKDQEDKRQFDERLKQEDRFHKAEQLLAQAGYDLNKEVASTGIEEKQRKIISEGGTPSGYEDVTPSLDQDVANLGKFTGTGQPLVSQQKIFKRQGESTFKPSQIVAENPQYTQNQAEEALARKEGRQLSNQKTLAQFEADIIDAEHRQQFEFDDRKLAQDLILSREEMANRLKIAGIQANKPASGVQLAKADMFGALYRDNPKMFFDPNVGTKQDKLLGAAAMKRDYGVDIISHGEQAAIGPASRALEIIRQIRSDPQFKTGAKEKSLAQTKTGVNYTNSLKLESLKSNMLEPEIQAFNLKGTMSDGDREFMMAGVAPIDIGMTYAELIKYIDRVEPALKASVSRALTSQPPDKNNRKGLDSFLR